MSFLADLAPSDMLFAQTAFLVYNFARSKLLLGDRNGRF